MMGTWSHSVTKARELHSRNRPTWIPRLPAVQAFLVGDPNQLPATVLSSAALEHGYNTSMFERLQAAGHPVQVNQYE
jgi:hypothetical protein